MRAAFPSRPWDVPQLPHVRVRARNGTWSARAPQFEHSWDEGKKRSVRLSTVTVPQGRRSTTPGVNDVTVPGLRRRSGSPPFPSVSSPAPDRNPPVVYWADLRDLFRDVKRGYSARLPEKFENAVCTCRNVRACRSVCRYGTDDTSLRQAGSSVLCHAVSMAEVWLSWARSCRAHAAVRVACAML